MVHVIGIVDVSSESSPSGSLRVSLPFAPANLDEYANSGYTRGLTVSNYADGDANSAALGWFDSTDGATIPMYQLTNATGAIAGLRDDDVDSAFSVSVNVSYLTAA